jgi:hypothetical protein
VRIAQAQLVVNDPLNTVETTDVAISDDTIASVAVQNLPLQAHNVVINSAIFGVENGQLSVSTAALAATIEKYAQDVALQIAINTLTSLMQRKVLTWIQGSGAPRFVTDWGEELANSFTTAATNQLNNWMACIPPYQAPIIRALLTTPTTALNNACAGEFNGQLAYNLQNFSTQFSNFTNYLNLFQPGGNSWGLVIQVQDSVVSNAAAAQQANTNQNIAQQGWKASTVGTCDDGSSPNGSADLCVSSNGTNYYINPNSSAQCNKGDKLEFVPNNGTCPDGNNPKISSPGQVTGQSFFTALKAGPESITSAKNIAGLLNALTTSLLNTLAQSAISFSTSQLNNALNGTSGGAQDSGLLGVTAANLSSSSSTQSGVQCIPATQNSILVDSSIPTVAVTGTVPSASSLLANTSSSEADASFSAAGGALDTNCAAGGACPSTENPDGSPIYSWLAPGSLQAMGGSAAATGTSFFATYNTPGTYVVTVTASTDNSTSTCEVTVQ